MRRKPGEKRRFSTIHSRLNVYHGKADLCSYLTLLTILLDYVLVRPFIDAFVPSSWVIMCATSDLWAVTSTSAIRVCLG